MSARVERDYDECPQCDDVVECVRAFEDGRATQRCLACGHVQKWVYPQVQMELGDWAPLRRLA